MVNKPYFEMKMDSDSEISENEEIGEIQEANSAEQDEVNSTGKRPLISEEHSENKRVKLDKKRNAYFQPPTTDELNYLKETESLYNSNLFRLQIEELLAQINLKSTREAQIEAWWSKFQAFIKSMKPKGDVDFAMLDSSSQKPWTPEKHFALCLAEKKINFATDEDVILKFGSPESAELVGAHSLRLSTATDLHLDVSVKMPRSCFRDKDYLNNRYFIKRHFYTVYVFNEFGNTQLCKKVKLFYYGGHRLMPFIQLTPSFDDRFKINVHVSGSEHVFKLHRFRPDKNNIKIDLFDEFHDVDAREFEDLGTPLYNSLMARDLTLSLNHSHMQMVLKLKNVQDGIKLVSVWLKQKELGDGLGGFELELVLYCIMYLSAKKKINQHMSSYQVVRVFWAFLCDTDWHEGPLSLADDVKDEVLRLYKENYELTLLDYSGFYNVASFLNYDVYLKVKGEAQTALNILDGNKFDSFHSLFITRVPFSLQCDAILKLRDSENYNSIYETIERTKKWKYYGFYKQLIIREITDVLKRGLAKRASHIIPHISKENKLHRRLESLNFGLVLDPAHAFNVIEKGPLEDDPKSEEFRLFWKGLSDLRRFEDGTVREAVYFKTETIAERRNIFLKILDFIFGKFEPVKMQVVCKEAERQDKTNVEDLCLKIKGAYDDLGKKLRELKQLPLAITSMQGISDSFSYTECKPPKPVELLDVSGTKLHKERYRIFNTGVMRRIIQKFPRYIAPLELVIQLGMSSKWPSDLTTLQHMKTQFYFEISKLLSEEHNLLSVVNFDYVDILHEGLVFRLRIFVPKELQLAKKCISSEGVVSYKDNETSLALEKRLEMLPKVTSALHGVQMQFPSFGPSTVIIKRWVRSQLLDDSHIPDVVLNLLNASLYLNTGAFNAPTLPQVAFVRFLKFLGEVDWNLNPVVVNFNNEINSAGLNEMEVNFQQNRRSYPPLCIITPYDSGRSMFTRGEPSKEVLRRLSLLGAEAYKIIQESIMKRRSFSVQKLFVPNLEGYDLVIHLLKKSVSNEKKKSTQGEVVFPIVGFNHVQLYLQHLRKTYGKFALFFHDTYKTSDEVITVLWKRKALEASDFKVLDCSGMKCVGDKLKLNKEALIHDFFVCGTGLVATIKKGS